MGIVYGPKWPFYSCCDYIGLLGTGFMQVLYLGRAPRTKETLPDFLKWRRVTRHPLVFRGLTGSQRTPGFGASHKPKDNLYKKSQYRFCKNIFTPQTYGMEEDRKEKKNKPYRKYNKRYFLKRSTRKEPYLDPNRHVIKYNPKRVYKNKLKCYACGESDHLSTNCPRKKNLYNTRSMLLECTNKELIEIDEEISYTETIYSIVSIKEGKENLDSENEDLINDLAELKLLNT